MSSELAWWRTLGAGQVVWIPNGKYLVCPLLLGLRSYAFSIVGSKGVSACGSKRTVGGGGRHIPSMCTGFSAPWHVPVM